jgi:WD40-like Beta Propeller Repeat
MKKILNLIFWMSAFVAAAQTGSEIYLADLKIGKTSISLSNSKNITNRKGYDNQPGFDPDMPIVYFSSFNDEGRSDIKTFNYKTNETKLFTKTPEREYSPTVTPDRNFISCIVQRDNNAQDLAKYPKDGTEPYIIIDTLTVGYHAWLRATDVLVFILGEPNTLHHLDLMNDKDIVLAQNIGRSLQTIPGQSAVSFVDKSGETWLIKRYNGEIETICETLPGREDLAWTPDGKIVMSDGRQFYYYDTHLKDGWKLFYTSQQEGVSRVAISANGKKIAFVITEK